MDTSFLACSGRGDVVELKKRLAAGADIDQRDRRGNTALHEACSASESETVDVLLKAGARVDIANTSGKTALFVAAETGHAHAVKVLLAAGADKDAVAEDGMSPLCVASRNGFRDVVKLLLAAKPSLELCESHSSKTALILAAEAGYCDVVELLLQAGVNRNAKDAHGRTALTWAAFGGFVEDLGALAEAYTRMKELTADPFEIATISVHVPRTGRHHRTQYVMLGGSLEDGGWGDDRAGDTDDDCASEGDHRVCLLQLGRAAGEAAETCSDYLLVQEAMERSAMRGARRKPPSGAAASSAPPLMLSIGKQWGPLLQDVDSGLIRTLSRSSTAESLHEVLATAAGQDQPEVALEKLSITNRLLTKELEELRKREAQHIPALSMKEDYKRVFEAYQDYKRLYDSLKSELDSKKAGDEFERLKKFQMPASESKKGSVHDSQVCALM
eukprot:jgi/Mesvir1/2276/Mv19317-RA.1